MLKKETTAPIAFKLRNLAGPAHFQRNKLNTVAFLTWMVTGRSRKKIIQL